MAIDCGNKAQARSTTGGRAYLNIETHMGCVQAWGNCYSLPTYVIKHQLNTMSLIQFDSQEWADEWLTDNPEWDVVVRLDDGD